MRTFLEGNLKTKATTIGYAGLILFATRCPVGSAEQGDFDGDGRLSIGDVAGFMEGLQPAPSSMNGFDNDPDFVNLPDSLPDASKRGFYAGLTYLELLRRSVPDPLPHWMDVTDAWTKPLAQPPLPTDQRVLISLESASTLGGADDRIEMKLRFQTTARLRGFLILLENAENILRIPAGHTAGGWYNLMSFESGNRTSLGDFPFAAPVAPFLITNGRYVIQYGLFSDGDFSKAIEPGDYELMIPMRLPRQTPAGKYQVRVLQTSEVLFDDYSVAAPQISLPVELTVESDITSGWDEGVPPLDIDPLERRILGQIRFRLADGNGEPHADGEPVVVGNPGEDVSVRVQMRTEVPLNTVSYRFHWSSDRLRCTEYGRNDVKILFTNPEDNKIYLPRFPHQVDCEKGWILSPNHEADFHVGEDTDDSVQNYKDRPLEYFKPLGEWRDITEVKLHISGCAEPGQEIALTFRRFSVADGNSLSGLVRTPYSARRLWEYNTPNWSYDIDYQDGFVRVGEGTPRCPEDRSDPGVRFVLGTVSGSRGQVVAVPIMASAEIRGEDLQLALESDPPEVTVESVEMDVTSARSGEVVKLTAHRGEQAFLQECDAPGTGCTYGAPASFLFDGSVDARFTALLINTRVATDYPGDSLREIGRLRLRIPEDFNGMEIRLKNASFSIFLGGLPKAFETGGILLQDFYPAKEFREGVVNVIAPGRNFLRGDANLDKVVDLTDAITTLTVLFLGGGSLGCEDAADADDSGSIEITDPILLLGVLFLGSGSIPAPFPACGADSGPDGLGCEQTACGEQ